MAPPPIILVALPAQQELVQTLCDQVEIAAVFNPGRATLREAPAPVFADWDALRRHTPPGLCCFLAPYPSLKQDLLSCLEQGIHVLSAGPIPLSRSEFDTACQRAGEHRIHLHCGGQYLHSALLQQFVVQRRKPEFGAPVYLRLVQGGGQGLLAAWWSVCEALELARDLLDDPLDGIHITAAKQGNKHHAVLTGSSANRANSQLVVVPHHLPLHPDITLLGTGGLLSSRSTHNAAVLVGQAGVEFHHPPSLRCETAWLLHFLDRLADHSEPLFPDRPTLALHHRILRSLRRSLRQQQPLRVAVPR